MAVTYKQQKSVATWLSEQDFALVQSLAASNNVTIAAFLRAVIVDALNDERGTSPSLVHSNISLAEFVRAVVKDVVQEERSNQVP